METLTELGRHQICKMIGIKNPNSIFVKSKEAFLDRMNLYRTVYDIDKLVNTYKEELKKCGSEEEFIMKIMNDEKIVYDTVEREMLKAEALDIILGSGHVADALYATDEYSVFLRDSKSECTLRIYFESPLYEAFKFAVYGLYDCSNTLYDFVYKLTSNKFLASANDLNINGFSDDIFKNSLRAQMNLMSKVIIDIICPKYLNGKNVKYIKCAEVQLSSTVNKTVESLDKIIKEIRNADGCGFENANAELFTTTALAKNNSITLKNLIIPNGKSDKRNVFNYDEYTLIRYLRKIRGEHKSKYDDYLSNGEIELKVTQDTEIAWI